MRLDWLALRAASSPDQIALIDGGRQWQYAELNEWATDMAGRLRAAGVEAGDHVAVLMPNRPAYVCAIHALARLGAILVPLNVRLTPAELRWQMDRADCAFLLCSWETEEVGWQMADGRWQMADGGWQMATEESAIGHRPSAIGSGRERGPGVRRILSVDRPAQPGVEALDDLPARADGSREGRRLDLDAVQCIVFTSGTTGRPKGAMLTYGNHLASATASAFRLGTLPGDRWLACLPLYHVGGLAIVLRCCLYGTTLVLQAGFDPLAVGSALDTQAVTLISLVPTMLGRLLEARGQRRFPESLRCVLLGGAAAPATLVERSLALGVPVATTYGLTEAASQVATATPDQVCRKAGAPSTGAGHFVGRPLMFSQVRIAGADGHDQPPGEIGDIEIRGPTVMAGYYRGPGATREVLRNGWLRTGDMGYLDQDGDLWVVQRRSDLIVTGGENVYPAEVERVILEVPGVEAACVIGVEDEEWGQRVVAAVVTDEGADVTEAELAAFCRARLAGYKQPRGYRFLTSLPQTASGKVRKDAVAAWFFQDKQQGG